MRSPGMVAGGRVETYGDVPPAAGEVFGLDPALTGIDLCNSSFALVLLDEEEMKYMTARP